MSVRIAAISTWLPEKVLTNNEINLLHPEWSIDKISTKTGIEERRIVDDDVFVSEMAVNAANKLFLEHNIDKSKIDFLLLCTQSPDYFLPTTSCIVQDKLQLSKNIGALDFNLGCSGYVYGLGLAKGLITSGSAKNVLLITAETYTKFIHSEDKSNKTIFGDAATASLISIETEGFLLGEFIYGTDGSGAENLMVKNGGIKFRNIKSKDQRNESNSFIRNDDFLYMDGSEIFKFTSTNVPILVADVLNKNNLLSSSIDFYLFHQANKFMLEFIRNKMDIPKEKFIYYLKYFGNTVSSTIPIALECAIKEKKINIENKILLAGFGVGYSWSGCIIGGK